MNKIFNKFKFLLLFFSLFNLKTFYSNDLTKNSSQILFLSCMFSDLNGNLKDIIVPSNFAEKALNFGLSFDGSSIKGCSSIDKSDLLLLPDSSTLNLNSWVTDSGWNARVFCDIKNFDGTSFDCDARSFLKDAVKKANDLGFDPKCGVELEFFLLYQDYYGNLNTIDSHGYCDVNIDTQLKEFKEYLLYATMVAGILPEKIHHEVAPGQYEISLNYTDPVMMADRVLIAKQVIAECASMAGLFVNFSPKPIKNVNGSGMHIHMSLNDSITNKNIFYDETDIYKLSKTAKKFIAGNLNHIRELCLIFNASVNSFDRLVPGFEAPTYICWGLKNRSAALRIPEISPLGDKDSIASSMRVEFRFPDATCNPYLAITALILSGLDGIKNENSLVDPIENNIFQEQDLFGDSQNENLEELYDDFEFDIFSDDDFQEKILKTLSTNYQTMNIETMPNSYTQALSFFENSNFAKEIFGSKLHKKYLEIKKLNIA